MPYVSALATDAGDALRELESSLERYYANPQYHEQWIQHANARWQPHAHGAQLVLAQRIQPGATLLEVGCGDTSAATELLQRIDGLRYCGVDLTIPRTAARDLRLARSTGTNLPFGDAVFDNVVSMFTIEHVVYPHRFLDECWRVLRAGGKLQIIAPDFLNNAMMSERMGVRYGSGRDKLMRGLIGDALLTLYDSRFRLPFMRRRRRRMLARGDISFPILTTPRCLRLPGFITDCDAVYAACPEEIENYMRSKYGARAVVFHRDQNTFGIEVVK